MKWLLRIGGGLLILLVVLVVILSIYLGSIVKLTVEKGGSALVGVPIKLEKVQFRLLRGYVQLKGFELGNPEGYKTDNAIRVGEITVDLAMRSLLSDTIEISRVYVNAPEITYEVGLGESNIGRIMKQMAGKEQQAEAKAPADKPAAAKGEGKKVVIDDFLIENGKVKLSTTAAMGAAAPIPLPAIHLTGIGREEGKQGATPLEVATRIFGAIAGSVTDVATGALKLLGKGAAAVGSGAASAAGAAADAAGSAASAVGDGAGEVIKGVGGLLGLGGDKKEPTEKSK